MEIAFGVFVLESIIAGIFSFLWSRKNGHTIVQQIIWGVCGFWFPVIVLIVIMMREGVKIID